MSTQQKEHLIVIQEKIGIVTVRFEGRVIVKSKMVLLLEESRHLPVLYFPKFDADFTYLSRSEFQTYCPYKGTTSYYHLNVDGKVAENAVWSYESPYPSMSQIQNYIAFYSDNVSITTE